MISISTRKYNRLLKDMVFRSCWNCNPAHKHLKKADYMIICFVCNKPYWKGQRIKIKGEDKE